MAKACPEPDRECTFPPWARALLIAVLGGLVAALAYTWIHMTSSYATRADVREGSARTDRRLERIESKIDRIVEGMMR